MCVCVCMTTRTKKKEIMIILSVQRGEGEGRERSFKTRDIHKSLFGLILSHDDEDCFANLLRFFRL